MAGKKTVVFAVASTMFEMRVSGQNPTGWRPTLALCNLESFPIDELNLWVPSEGIDLAPRFLQAINDISPHTQVFIYELDAVPVMDMEQQYLFFSNFFSNYAFNPANHEYYVNLPPGGMFLFYMSILSIIHARNLPIQFIFIFPEGTILFGDPSAGVFWDQVQIPDPRALESALLPTRAIEVRNNKFASLLSKLESVARSSSAPLLIMGETGSGKSQLARAVYLIKQKSGMLAGPFIEASCATLRGDSALSTLFGHVKGAYTSAVNARQGLLRQAHNGLLFLDEIGEMDLNSQALLLKAIEEKNFFPVGADAPVHSNFQFICGTNRDLLEETHRGAFREDLFARINLWTFRLPPLRERPEDMEANLDFELNRLGKELGRRCSFTSAARKRFLEFALHPSSLWKGNFRDLHAAVTRMGTLSLNGIIDIEAVEEEKAYLRALWAGPAATRPLLAPPPRPQSGLQPSHDCASADTALPPMNYFDRVQLEGVLKVCLQSDTLLEAGQKVFGLSHPPERQANRLSKYLKSCGFSWRVLKKKRQLL